MSFSYYIYDQKRHMMANLDKQHSREELNKFAFEQWDKTLAFLQGQFSLPLADCEDIFQDAFLVLYKNINDGKLANLTSSLTTYFNAICKNKAFEKLRNEQKEQLSIDDNLDNTKDEFENERIDRLLALEDNTEQNELLLEADVRQTLLNLPDPCNKILWGYYRDNLPLKTLAAMYNYKSENVVKVTKHRCIEKFKLYYKQISNHLNI